MRFYLFLRIYAWNYVATGDHNLLPRVTSDESARWWRLGERQAHRTSTVDFQALTHGRVI